MFGFCQSRKGRWQHEDSRDTSSLMQWKQEWRGSTWRPHVGNRKIRSWESKRMGGRSHEQDRLNPDTTNFIKWVSFTKMSETSELDKSERNPPRPAISYHLAYGSNPANRTDSPATTTGWFWALSGAWNVVSFQLPYWFQLIWSILVNLH